MTAVDDLRCLRLVLVYLWFHLSQALEHLSSFFNIFLNFLVSGITKTLFVFLYPFVISWLGDVLA